MKNFFDVFKKRNVALIFLLVSGLLSIIFDLVYNITFWSDDYLYGPRLAHLIIITLFVLFIIVGYILNNNQLFKVGFTFLYIYLLIDLFVSYLPSSTNFSSLVKEVSFLFIIVTILGTFISLLAITILVLNILSIFKLVRNSLLLITSLMWLIIVGLFLLIFVFEIVLVAEELASYNILFNVLDEVFIFSFIFIGYGIFIEIKE